MTVAYILINTELGSEDEIQEKLIKYPEGKEAYVVYGVYDLIIKIESDKLHIKHTIKTKLFLKPCLITNRFCGPIAMIKLKPIIKPWIYSKIFILYYV